MKEIIIKKFNRKQTTQNYSKKISPKKLRVEPKNLTVFEPKISLKTDAIPLSHMAFVNIDGLKSYLKDSPVCLDLDYYQPITKLKNYFLHISGHLSIFFK